MSMPTWYGAEVGVPDERAAAAAAEVDDDVAGPGREERPQHVVADLRAQQRRRHVLVARVGVQRLVEVLRLLGETHAGVQVEVLRVRGEPAVAGAAGEVGRRAADGAAAIRAPHQFHQPRRNHARLPITASSSASMRSARLSQVHSRTSSRACAARRDASAASPSTRARPAASDPASPGFHEDRVLVRPQHLAQRRQVRRDDGPPRRHVLEQLQRRRVGGRHAAGRVGQRPARRPDAAAPRPGEDPPARRR